MDDENKGNTTEETNEEAPAAPVAPAVPTVAKEAGSVTLTGEQFAAMMGQINDLNERVTVLGLAGNKNKIQEIENLRKQGKLIKSVKIRRVGDLYVVGWKTLEDEVYRDENGRLVEKQTIKIFFDDATDKDMSMRQWNTAFEYVPFEVLSESKNADGDIFFKVKGPDGKELEIGITFIN